MHKHIKLGFLTATAALLVACGGGGGDISAAEVGITPDSVPAAATASADAFTRFAAGLAEDDQREPLPVADLAPPASDTAEAAPVTR